MDKKTILISILSLSTGYFIGRSRKYRKLFHYACDAASIDNEQLDMALDDIRRLEDDMRCLERNVDRLEEDIRFYP